MCVCVCVLCVCVFFQAEDGIRDLVRSRGLGDVYKRQDLFGYRQSRGCVNLTISDARWVFEWTAGGELYENGEPVTPCLLYTSDAADERSSVDLGGRRIIKKKNSR